MPNRLEVAEVVYEERDYQEEMGAKNNWGNGGGASNHSVGDFMTMIQAYLEEARDQYIHTVGDQAVLHVVRKITALGFACMERHGAPRRIKK